MKNFFRKLFGIKPKTMEGELQKLINLSKKQGKITATITTNDKGNVVTKMG